MSEQNRMLVQRAIEEVWNRGNYAILNEFVTDDIVVHAATPSGEIHGPEGIMRFYSTLRLAFPDLHFTVEDQVAQGDRVVTRWTVRGTHQGMFQGIAPTGKQVRVMGTDFERIVDNRVVECWPIMDELSLLQQLEALPVAGEGAG